MFFMLYILNSQPHILIIYLFSVFYTFFFYIFYVRCGFKTNFLIKRAMCVLLYEFVTRKRVYMLENVIQHDDQRQIALLCKEYERNPSPRLEEQKSTSSDGITWYYTHLNGLEMDFKNIYCMRKSMCLLNRSCAARQI